MKNIGEHTPYITSRLNEAMNENKGTAAAVIRAYNQFCSCDWGIVPDEDKASNYADLEAHEGRILARYKTPSGDIYITMEFYEEPPVVMLMFRDEY